MDTRNGVTQVASALPRAGFEPYVEVRRTTTKDPRLTVGKAEYGTILGDYRIDETEVSAEISEVREDSTGRDDDNDSADTCLGMAGSMPGDRTPSRAIVPSESVVGGYCRHE
jgi:hypothetical protein